MSWAIANKCLAASSISASLPSLTSTKDHEPSLNCKTMSASRFLESLYLYTFADAIMDRIVHNSITIESGNVNMR